jgi:hypothetical protein
MQSVVYFVPGDSSSQKQRVYDISSVYALFISGNPEVFQCMMHQSLRKAYHVTNLYEHRTQDLANNAPYVLCATLYDDALTSTGYFDLMTNALEDDGYFEINQLQQSIRDFDRLNSNLEHQSCPLIY